MTQPTADSEGSARTRLETPSDHEVVIIRVTDGPRQQVWNVWTQPAHVRQWLLGPEGWAMPVCEIDLRPGGAWRYVWSHAEGGEMEMHGEFREVSPPVRLVSTERWGPEWPETINTIEFTEDDGKTTVRMTVRYPSKEARDAALQTGMAEGIERSYGRLDKVVRSGG